MPSINNSHPTLKSWCFRFCSNFICPSYDVVCRQTVSYAKHMENIAQQSGLFVAIKNVVCEQTNSYADHTEFFHSNQIHLLQSRLCEQMIPYAEHTADSVLYPDFLLRSFLHFESFWPLASIFAWQLRATVFLVLSKIQCLRHPAIFFGNFHPLIHLISNHPKVSQNYPTSESCIPYLELVFCISVVNSDTARKGTFTE